MDDHFVPGSYYLVYNNEQVTYDDGCEQPFGDMEIASPNKAFIFYSFIDCLVNDVSRCLFEFPN